MRMHRPYVLNEKTKANQDHKKHVNWGKKSVIRRENLESKGITMLNVIEHSVISTFSSNNVVIICPDFKQS